MTPYQMEINNAARHIMDTSVHDTGNAIDVFVFSSVLGVVHCKDKAEVALDIIAAGDTIAKEENRKKPLQFHHAEKIYKSE
jgi:hypothetical protein